MRQKISIVTLGVADLERSLSFYRDGLGWQPSGDSQADIVFFGMGGVVLALYPREKLAEDALVDPAGSGFSGITLSYNAKSQAEVDQALATVENLGNLGAKLIKSARQVFWGGYSGYFADPDGHLWEVAWAPTFEFDSQDNLILSQP